MKNGRQGPIVGGRSRFAVSGSPHLVDRGAWTPTTRILRRAGARTSGGIDPETPRPNALRPSERGALRSPHYGS